MLIRPQLFFVTFCYFRAKSLTDVMMDIWFPELFLLFKKKRRYQSTCPTTTCFSKNPLPGSEPIHQELQRAPGRNQWSGASSGPAPVGNDPYPHFVGKCSHLVLKFTWREWMTCFFTSIILDV